MRFGVGTYGFYKRTGFILMFPFISIIPLVSMFWFSISSILQKHLLKDADTSLKLLQAYESWYKIILLAGLVILVLVVAIVVTHIVLMIRFRDDITVAGWIQSIFLTVISMGLVIFMEIAMITSEEVPTLLKNVQEDIQQVQSGQLEVGEVWFNNRTAVTGLPGPFSGEEMQVVTQYRGIGERTNSSWTSFYVPTFLPFQFDTEDAFNESRSIEWNEENTSFYRIHYTSNMNLVTEIEQIR